MAQSLKQAIVSKFRDILPAQRLNNLLFDVRPTATGGAELHLNSAQFRPFIADSTSWQHAIAELGAGEHFTKNGVRFALDKDALLAAALSGSSQQVASPSSSPTSQTILVEFSSPNIAKPFHVGHLRSTIIGQFCANILRRSPHSHRVRSLNYLGDWGTQFGYLAVGMQLLQADGTEQQRSGRDADPIRYLFEAYVRANAEAKTDAGIALRAKELFCALETGDGAPEASAELQQWSEFREHTVRELRATYQRLGVEFDEYCWESDYRRPLIEPLLQRMRETGILQPDEAGSAALVTRVADRWVPMIKSDGTSVYLTRDCAAMADRAETHRFDRMLYVVDNGQFDHFRSLFAVAGRMGVAGVEGAEHVKFGRIQGMSTRRGQVVFLRDILDEAQERMWARQVERQTTRVDVSDTADRKTADILGMSAVIVNDLKQRRTRDYQFDWDNVLQMNGDTGIKLQYTHCRLCSLAGTCEAAGVRPATSVDLTKLREPEAEHLLFELARYEDVLVRSEQQLEACVLVVYLFGLCNTVSRALKKLNVKDHPDEAVRAQRLLLFGRTREVLHDGMRILGLQPLQKM